VTRKLSHVITQPFFRAPLPVRGGHWYLLPGIRDRTCKFIQSPVLMLECGPNWGGGGARDHYQKKVVPSRERRSVQDDEA
jgi:hypothetical protein